MNKYISGLVAAAGFMIGGTFVNAQTVHPVCGNGNEGTWQQAIQIDPTLVERRAQMVKLLDQYIQTHNHFNDARTDAAAGANDTIYNIPVVFHIIQDGNQDGNDDNIPDEQVRNCVQIMNADYRRQNADADKTLIPFKPIAADTRIQFQLATIDPNGNCTNGITRSFSHRTVNFNDFGKSIIDWPSDKYFNIWTVASISGAGFLQGGMVIGYAQFPVSGPSATDGVVLSYDFVGDIDAANVPIYNYAGRDGDHETGHYFNLIHTWGDANCGNDQVDDTPTQYTETYGCPCGTPGDTCYVYDDSCGSPNPPGIIYQDYMDYTDGACKNLFTRGQAERMWATLNVARVSLWQPENLSATGTDTGTISSFNSDSVNNPNCAPQADFLPIHANICPGVSIKYAANTTNGTPTTWNWTFTGGTPSTYSGLLPPDITYNSEGNYPVTLTVSNANGTSTITKNNIVIVDAATGVESSFPFTEGFENEGSLAVPNGWNVFNDDGGPAWQRTNRAAHTGSYSMSVQNYETYANTAPGSWKELQLPSFNFSSNSQPVLNFYLSYGQQTSSNDDSLSIEASINCGASWTPVTHLAGSALASGSGGLQPDNFAPTSSQWAFVSVPLSFYANKDKVKLRFLFVSGTLSNNIYIDDINIKDIGLNSSGISEEQNPTFNFNAVPNPATQSFTVNYLLNNSEDVIINLYDLQGRLIKQIENDHQTPGAHENKVDGSSFNLATGLYILKMITPDGLVSKKLMYSNE